MLKTRIIPCLDVADGRVVKGVNFVDLIDAGDPDHAETVVDYLFSQGVKRIDLLAAWERPSFAPDPRAHAVESVNRAIAVVSRW